MIPNTFGSAGEPRGVLGLPEHYRRIPDDVHDAGISRCFPLDAGTSIGMSVISTTNMTDVNNPSQSYRAHLPFTSLRFYFGGVERATARPKQALTVIILYLR